jgi:hypothetical protein
MRFSNLSVLLLSKSQLKILHKIINLLSLIVNVRLTHRMEQLNREGRHIYYSHLHFLLFGNICDPKQNTFKNKSRSLLTMCELRYKKA